MFIIAKFNNWCNKVIMTNDMNLSAKEILDFYILSGVTETCGEKPFCASLPSSGHPQLSSGLALSSASALQNAEDVCALAASIEELKAVMDKFEGCSLKNTASHTVVGDGNPQAKIMLIGEAPGAEEDLVGKAFVGRSGKLLDKIISSIGLDRSTVYICNVLPWRPPGNRTPSDAEVAVCLPFLKRQIEIVNPDYILTLGVAAVNALLGLGETMSHLRGRWLEYETSTAKKIKVLATYHPAYLLRTPQQKSKVWADFLKFRKELQKNN